VSYSSDRGNTFTKIANAAESTDRPDFPAIAISPNGHDVWLDYDAFHTPWQTTTASLRPMEGVVRHATTGGGGALSAFSTVQRGATGDARGSSANSLGSEFLGDYNYVAASNSSAVAVWNDVRNAADCPAIDAFRAGGPTPAPGTNCPATFGNSDIWSGRFTP
jgi:hypothetical protein